MASRTTGTNRSRGKRVCRFIWSGLIVLTAILTGALPAAAAIPIDETVDPAPGVGHAVSAFPAEILACSASTETLTPTTSASDTVLLECTLDVPSAGSILILGNVALGWEDGSYTAHMGVGVDAPITMAEADRWASVRLPEETGQSLSLSLLRAVSPGSHTIYMLGRRSAGEGTALFQTPALSVIYLPGGSSYASAYGAASNMVWTTTSAAFGAVREVSLEAPSDGWLWLISDGTLTLADDPYEAHLAIGIDGMSGEPSIDRWVDVAAEPENLASEPYALSGMLPITEGSHTVYLLARRYSGDGTVRLCDPTLTAIYVPSPSPGVVRCSVADNLTRVVSAPDWTVVRQCTMRATRQGWMLVMADASAAPVSSAGTVELALGVDAAYPLQRTERAAHVTENAGDGTDRSIALASAMQVSAGSHAVYLLARIAEGSGDVLLYDPTLSALRPGARAYVPVVCR